MTPAGRRLHVVGLSRGSVPCEFTTRLAVDAGLEVTVVRHPRAEPAPQAVTAFRAWLADGKRGLTLDEASLASELVALAARADAFVVDEWGRDQVRGLGRPVVTVGERDCRALEGVAPEDLDEFLAFHATGLGYLTPRVMPGYPSAGPLCPDAHLLEFQAGLYGAIALFALLRRGPGDAWATVGLAGAALPLLRREAAAVLYEGARPHRAERIWKVSPAEVHRCTDGWVFVDVIEDEQWQRLSTAIGRPELGHDERYATREQRFAHAEELCALLDRHFAGRPKACWIEAQAAGVPVAPVQTIDDLLGDEQLRSRGFWRHVPTATSSAAGYVPVHPLARAVAALGPPEPRGAADGAPLADLRVVELTHVWSGPLAGQILADLGAEVIRVESPSRLDIHRRGGPYPEGRAGVNRSGTWNAQNRGKRSCTLDLKSAEGRTRLLALVRESDAVIENFTPMALERLGLGFETLAAANPRVLLLSLSGFGHSGPHRDSLAYGPMMDAATGLSAATTYGEGIPRAANGWAADVGGALYGAAALVRCLLEEPRRARHLDISQFEAGVMFCAETLLSRTRPDAGERAPRARFTAAAAGPDDRWLAISPRTSAQLDALRGLVGGTGQGRDGDAIAAALEARVRAWCGGREAPDALAALRAAGVPAVPVSTMRDLLDDPLLAARSAWLDTEHAEVGRLRSYGPAIRLGHMAPSRRAAPCLGADNTYVFERVLGLPRERPEHPAGYTAV